MSSTYHLLPSLHHSLPVPPDQLTLPPPHAQPPTPPPTKIPLADQEDEDAADHLHTLTPTNKSSYPTAALAIYIHQSTTTFTSTSPQQDAFTPSSTPQEE